MGSGLGGRIYTSDTWALLTLFVNSAGNGQADLSAVSDIIHTCVPVAQGIERLPSKQRVAGSNPAWDATTSFRACSQAIFVYSPKGSVKHSVWRDG